MIKKNTKKELAETLIEVVGYPATFHLNTFEKLPKFSGRCKVRDRLLLEALIKLEIDSPCHAYEDYTVERVDKKGRIEFWHLGS